MLTTTKTYSVYRCTRWI